MKITRPKIESDVNYAHADVSSFDFEKTIGDKKQDLILLETSATCNLVGGPDFHRTIGREPRERVSHEAFVNQSWRYRAAASTSMKPGLVKRKVSE
jgi:hypothetical protein